MLMQTSLLCWNISVLLYQSMSRTLDGHHQARSLFCLSVGLLSLVLGACSDPPDTELKLDFDLTSTHFDDCGEGVFMLYLSNPRLVDLHGQSFRLRLDPESPWQTQSLALLSLAGDCDGVNRASNASLQGRAPRGDYQFFEFELGVPFKLNHANPLEAPSPLDLPVMFWTWQTGYKFLRVDLGNQWSFHLGSTGCDSASAVRAPAQPCRQPNLARYRIPIAHGEPAKILLDLDALLQGIDVSDQENCVEAYKEKPVCRTLLKRLGLDATTGQCIHDCTEQVLFRSDEDR